MSRTDSRGEYMVLWYATHSRPIESKQQNSFSIGNFFFSSEIREKGGCFSNLGTSVSGYALVGIGASGLCVCVCGWGGDNNGPSESNISNNIVLI